MPTLYTQQSKNITKTWILMSVFLCICVALGYLFANYFQNPTILTFAIVFSIVMNMVGFWYSDKIAIATTKAFKADEREYLELHRIVENLAMSAGLLKPKVYIIPDDSMNAFATGRNQKNATIAVTRGLLNNLDRVELEGVIAHELAHIGNRDILLQSMVVVLVGFISLLSDFFLRGMLFGSGDRDNDNKASGVLMIVGLIFIILSPIIAKLIQLAISRKREFLADATGALISRYPEGLASALQKISSQTTPLKTASDATAHLFIANPFGANLKKGIHKLFMTHPPVEERIKALLN